jgi:DNA-directed RNA polymerase specialized sigma subunit
MAQSADENLLNELTAVKRLLVYALLNKHKEEHTQDEIAFALGISQSQVSRMFAKPREK